VYIYIRRGKNKKGSKIIGLVPQAPAALLSKTCHYTYHRQLSEKRTTACRTRETTETERDQQRNTPLEKVAI